MQTNDQGDPSDHFTENMMTQSDHDNHEAMVLGDMKPDQAWILTDRDVWHKNPYYTGPAVPHPEDYDEHHYMTDADREALARLNQ